MKNSTKWLLGILIGVIIIGIGVGVFFWKNRQSSVGINVVNEGRDTTLVGKTMREQVQIIQNKYQPLKNEQLYVINTQIKPPNDILNNPANIFDFKNYLAIVDYQTGQYKIIKPILLTTTGAAINLDEWKIDSAEALRIAQPKFDIYNSRYPDSQSGIAFYYLHQKLNQKPEWKIIYGVSEDYYNANKTSPLAIFINAETGKITFTRGI